MDALASRLDASMTDKGVKIPTLVKVTGISYQGIKKILDGKTESIQAGNLFSIAAYLGVDPYWLWSGESLDVSAWMTNNKMSASVHALAGPPTPSITLLQALEAIDTALAPLDEQARRPAVRMLGGLETPQSAGWIAAHVKRSLSQK